MNNKLDVYKELRDSIDPESDFYTLINVRVSRYEINLIKYNLDKEERHKLVLNAIEKILDNFINIRMSFG